MNYIEIEKPTKKPRKKQRAADDGLRPLFFKHLKHHCQWTPIETGDIIGGVPDAEFFFEGGHQGWIEFKATDGWKPVFRPLQVAWIDRRSRLHGNVWIAVRRRVRQVDDLYLVPGHHVKELNQEGLTRNVLADSHCLSGGPRSWRWSDIRVILCA